MDRDSTKRVASCAKQVITTYSKASGLVDHNVYLIHEDASGAVWIGAWYGGLSRYKDGKFKNYTTRDGLPSVWSRRSAKIRRGGCGSPLTAMQAEAACESSDRGDSRPLTIMPDRSQVSAICEDRTGAFWFGSENGLIRYKDGVGATWTTKDGLAGNEVKVIINDAAGDLWIGGYGGLSRFKDGNFNSWTERDGLASNTVRALYEDRDGVLWIGTYDGGLGRFKDGQFTRYTTKEGLFNNGVFQILEDARGNFWMSCNRGIYRVSKQELNEFAAGRLAAITSIAYGKSDGMLNRRMQRRTLARRRQDARRQALVPDAGRRGGD